MIFNNIFSILSVLHFGLVVEANSTYRQSRAADVVAEHPYEYLFDQGSEWNLTFVVMNVPAVVLRGVLVYHKELESSVSFVYTQGSVMEIKLNALRDNVLWVDLVLYARIGASRVMTLVKATPARARQHLTTTAANNTACTGEAACSIVVDLNNTTMRPAEPLRPQFFSFHHNTTIDVRILVRNVPITCSGVVLMNSGNLGFSHYRPKLFVVSSIGFYDIALQRTTYVEIILHNSQNELCSFKTVFLVRLGIIHTMPGPKYNYECSVSNRLCIVELDYDNECVTDEKEATLTILAGGAGTGQSSGGPRAYWAAAGALLVGAALAGLLALVVRRRQRAPKPVPTPPVTINPFYLNMLFRAECQRQIEAEEEAHYEEID